MPISMPKEALITIQKRNLPSAFEMPQMEMAVTHFSLVYLMSGDRRIITPYQQFDAHAGNLTLMPPLLYHRTFSLSDAPYDNYLVKISDKLAEEFCRDIDPNIWRHLYDQKYFSLRPEDSESARRILEDMLYIYEQDKDYSEAVLKGLMYRLMILLWEKNTASDMLVFKNRLSENIMDAMYYVEQNYTEDIKLKDAAAEAGFSEGHFSRLFTSQVGVPFSEYLINIRLRHAKELLINTDMSVSEIAMHTGFSNADYLSASFGKREGFTPTAYRKQSGIKHRNVQNTVFTKG